MLSKSLQLPLVAAMVISLLGCCMEIDISRPSFPSIMVFLILWIEGHLHAPANRI